MDPALVLQHAQSEGPYEIAAALDRAGIPVRVVRADLGEPVPADLPGVSALVVMGGPMSARSDDGFPTRRAEMELVRDALSGGVPVLGVCLGAQLLAAAAGGRVIPGEGLEIGWSPIRLVDDAASDPLFAGLPEKLTVLHWHGETYELPEGAVRLAGSEMYPQQAFRIGDSAWGMQFHLEVDAGAVDAFVEQFPEEADQALGGAGALRGMTEAALDELDQHRTGVLDRFAAVVAHAGPR